MNKIRVITKAIKPKDYQSVKRDVQILDGKIKISVGDISPQFLEAIEKTETETKYKLK